MASLPQELLERIASFADRQTNANLLTVSRNFHVAVERVEFPRSIDVSCRNLDKLLKLYHGHRLALLRKVTFELSFPKLQHSPEKPLACRETPEDLKALDKDFTRQIKELFTALHTLQERVYSSESSRLSRLSLEIQIARQTDDGNKPCHHRRFTSWSLRLLEPETLPALHAVHSFHFHTKSHDHYSPFDHQIRPVDLCAILDIVAKLPNLEDLDLPYLYERPPPCHYHAVCDHYDQPWPGPLRDARHDFARRILALSSSSPPSLPIPPSLRSARIHFSAVQQHGPRFDQRSYRRSGRQQQLLRLDLVHPLAADPLSTALRRLSLGLVELDLRATVDSTLFWPLPSSAVVVGEEEDEAPPSWPRLKRMRVELDIARPDGPDGSYWFRGRRADDDADGSSREQRGYPVIDSDPRRYPPLGPVAADAEWDRVWEARRQSGRGGSGDMEAVREYVFRVAPDAEKVEGLLAAFARAVGRMPVLEVADVFAVLTKEGCRDGGDGESDGGDGDDDGSDFDEYEDGRHLFEWGVKYVVAGGGRERRVEWRVGEWRPSQAVLDLFGESGGGVEVRHVWLPTKYSRIRMLDGKLYEY